MRAILLLLLTSLGGPCLDQRAEPAVSEAGPARADAALREAPAAARDGAPASPAPLEVAGVRPLTRVGNILLAGQPSAAGLEALRQRGVTSVLDLRRADESRGFDERARVEELGLQYRNLGFGGPQPLEDGLLDEVRGILAAQRARETGELVLHGASANRAGAVWLASRVLDEGVAWEVALAEAQAAGLQAGPLQTRVRDYVLGAGNSELGRAKLEIRAKLPDVRGIDVAELAGRLERGQAPILLDARARAEFAVSHLPGAQWAETARAARTLLEGVPADREIVVYCSIGYRSAYLADELQAAGFSNVRNLEGSIFEWSNTGHPVHRDGQPVREVHPYDRKWGRMLERSLWSEIE